MLQPRPHVTTKETIVEKAMEIAKREGVDQVNVRKLAAACNMAVGSMYNYFPDKEAVIVAISELFWKELLCDQEKVYRRGMSFTQFLDQYYSFIYGRLKQYDRSWLKVISGRTSELEALLLFRSVLAADTRINASIWNMELNEDAFCDYVFRNIMALLKAGETNCRFFIFLLEHLLYG